MNTLLEMMPFKLALFLITLTVSFASSGQVTFVIESLPDNHPEGDSIYIAGSFNGWNPADGDFLLQEGDQPYITLDGDGPIAFKFTRGSWATVEGNASGEKIENRSYSFTGLPDTVIVSIASWEDLSGTANPVSSTRASNVTTIDQFEIPQLNRSRRIWIYLPPDYTESDDRYPVIYMHDGQNVFAAASSFSGE